jgi:pyruvate dehydrogenase E1 component alpha subunit
VGWFRGRAPHRGPSRSSVGRANGLPASQSLTLPDSPAPPVSTVPPGSGLIQESAFMSPATTETEATPAVSKSTAIDWLRQMLLIRRFEEQSYKLYQMGGKIGGFCHLYSGQEPVAVGSIGVLREDDFVITAYRDHGHALARGMGANEAMAELLGRYTGCSKGKGGSMHFFDAEKGFLGGHAIVGSHLPLAAGVAFASKYQGKDSVCICYFGDGAMNQGSLHEAFNMASLWKLPVIYVVENNMMSMGTQLHRHSCILDLVMRCGTAYGMPGYSIDANDIELVAETTRECAARARAGEGPSFIEMKTYRFRGHSMSDPAKYRTKEELEDAKARDPIVAYEQLLKERGWISDEAIERMHEEIKAEVDESIAFAEASEPTPLEALYQDVTVAHHIPQE